MNFGNEKKKKKNQYWWDTVVSNFPNPRTFNHNIKESIRGTNNLPLSEEKTVTDRVTMQEITHYFQPLSIFHKMEQTDSGLKVQFYSYRVKHDQMNSNGSPKDFYPGLILF